MKESQTTAGPSITTHSLKLKVVAVAITAGGWFHLMHPPHEEVVTTSIPDADHAVWHWW